MQITLTVPDTKADSFLDVLRHISYVKIKSSGVSKTKPKKPAEDSTEEFYEGLKDTVHELNEAIAGRKQLRTAEEWLDEFKSRAHC
jgi:CRISPR/Cas system-associated protein Csm6